MAQNKKQNKPAINVTPSLLEAESRGGDTNEGGIQFQAAVSAVYAARWLAQEGFTSMIREAIGDTEAQFYVPGYGYQLEFVEAKNHTIAPVDFWAEIDRFRRIDAGAPGVYQWFTLATAGLSDSLLPLVNGLRRVRDPYGFYESVPFINDHSYKEYVALVKKLKHSEDEAKFIYGKVVIRHDLVAFRSEPEAMFREELLRYHPEYENTPNNILKRIYSETHAFIQSRLAMPIGRIELEEVIKGAIPEQQRMELKPVQIYTSAEKEEDTKPRRELCLPWSDFSGGKTREYPLDSEWNDRLLGQLQGVKDWMVKNRSTRRIRLTGNRRLSASIAIGYTFPSVEGFSIEMVLRDNVVWATDDYLTSETPNYEIVTIKSDTDLRSDRLVVSLGIPRNIVDSVEHYLEAQGLADLPVLHLHSDSSVLSAQHVDMLLKNLKKVITSALSATGAQHIDLFLGVPAQVALFLGHRLNATASVQCYERVVPNTYIQTCMLQQGSLKTDKLIAPAT